MLVKTSLLVMELPGHPCFTARCDTLWGGKSWIPNSMEFSEPNSDDSDWQRKKEFGSHSQPRATGRFDGSHDDAMGDTPPKLVSPPNV